MSLTSNSGRLFSDLEHSIVGNQRVRDPMISHQGVLNILKLGTTVVLCAMSFYVAHRILQTALGEGLGVRVSKKAAKKVKEVLARKLGKKEDDIVDLDEYEIRITPNVIGCNELDVSFDDIGGMDLELEQVRDSVVIPLKHWQMFRDHSDILPCPTGVLLYGKPGTGKTMSAKAIAKEAGASFINVKASSILDKWLGESDKLATAIFTLARKLAPTVIFVDEIDTILRNREQDHGSSTGLSSLQGVFLSEWDGLQSSSENGAPVLVLGATNRISDLDKAILRRMPVTIQTKEPTVDGRLDILTKMIRTEQQADDLNIQEIADRTEGFTGSDLKELTRAAALTRVKAIITSVKADALDGNTSSNKSSKTSTLGPRQMIERPLSHLDFTAALDRMLAARTESSDYSDASKNSSGRLNDMSRFEAGLGIGLGMIQGSLQQIVSLLNEKR
eukprot:CAMPEP_0182416728 /NCGR_PEP_ID=MMETSP1167-20130531/1087_1 /TAXON_ID=2988 /ORGANISM="Mallomonas Sp, Strain CCMP3275" /LENGTH=445 /DNA_ID=CAMNT_0024589751 /DNA_START=85 /DNA_END=1422 /DNA_ORIENTATION=+